ncbi:hypothetical protein GJU94_08165 [Brucella sp. 10RB9214]|uniref:hypothetical protein n=1 Tax=unclassified Brucella TaxID=2632610 RepID=UPI000972B7A4|nr:MULTISPECIES: hypothetical protein [unclassified Brucella]APY13163.1 hypothetical protein BKD02_01580 [Brucella sp. 09RB8910]MRN46125.1 hypothetical protein [Brucella sp. 10RB9212]MRN49807.1 hypothetical protein [Brucella sp. 10RB9214]
MVTSAGPRKSSCNSGELDKLIAGRPDIKQYYSGGLKFKNIEPVPQSGFRLMPGSLDAGPVRKGLVAINSTGATSSFGPHSGRATIYQQTFASVAVSGVYVNGLSANVNFNFTVEVLVDGAWIAISAPLGGGAAAVKRFVAFPPSKSRTATAVRIVATPSETATYSLFELAAFSESGPTSAPRYKTLRQDQANGFMFAFGPGFCDIWKNKTWVACIYLPMLTASMLPDIDFYAEASTVGVFHEDLQTIRLRRAGSDYEWAVDLWPYDGVPEIDYGEVYPKTDDIWEIFVRWSEGDTSYCYLNVTVNGEKATAVDFRDVSTGQPVPIDGNDVDANWNDFVHRLAIAINNLPSIAGGVSVIWNWMPSRAKKLTIMFGGPSSGEEYEVSCLVGNTSEVSALPSHVQIGKTDGEPIISASRGWPGTSALMQDRLGYARLKGQTAAQILSATGEYFTLNIKASGDSAARLDKLRSQTSEKILRIKESKYFLAFTNLGAYFATNRTINRNEPLNYVLASEVGIRPNTDPIDLEGLLYYVANNGRLILSMEYDDVSTSYNANPETLLSSHLIEGIMRNARQVGSTATDTNRMWLLREDGRLLSANVIRNQDILGICEWLCADDGKIREIAIDGYNDSWISVDRGGVLRHEYMEENLLFQQAIRTTTDLAGRVAGLPYPDGTVLWCEADGFILGPYNCQGGAIDLVDAYSQVTVGRWIAPIYESMPHVLVLDDDRILRRPGRIHTANISVIGTTSIAVGANNRPAKDVALLETSDPADMPMPRKTKKIKVTGIKGHAVDTTLVITQLRPGYLQVRDYSTGEKL